MWNVTAGLLQVRQVLYARYGLYNLTCIFTVLKTLHLTLWCSVVLCGIYSYFSIHLFKTIKSILRELEAAIIMEFDYSALEAVMCLFR